MALVPQLPWFNSPGAAALSEAWWNARRGRITGSQRMHVLLNGRVKTKNAMLDTLALELSDDFVRKPEVNVKYTEWGHRQEPHALRNIAFMYDVDVRSPGIMVHPRLPILSCTPDFLLDDPDVTGELKCPYLLREHINLTTGGMKAKPIYRTQVQTELFVTGHRQAWFCSYHPDLPPGEQLHREVVVPDADLHNRMYDECLRLQDMLFSGARFGEGRTIADTGVPQIF